MVDFNSLFTSVQINVLQSVLDSLQSLHPELSRRVGPFMTCPGQGSLRVTCLGHSGDSELVEAGCDDWRGEDWGGGGRDSLKGGY